MRLLITGFRGRPNQRRHFGLQGTKGRCHGNQILAKIGQKSQNGHNFTCKRHIHAEFGFQIGFVPSGNSSVTLPYTTDKGATLHGNQFADKNYCKCTQMHFYER